VYLFILLSDRSTFEALKETIRVETDLPCFRRAKTHGRMSLRYFSRREGRPGWQDFFDAFFLVISRACFINTSFFSHRLSCEGWISCSRQKAFKDMLFSALTSRSAFIHRSIFTVRGRNSLSVPSLAAGAAATASFWISMVKFNRMGLSECSSKHVQRCIATDLVLVCTPLLPRNGLICTPHYRRN